MPVCDLRQLRSGLRYEHLNPTHWNKLCAHLKQFGKESIESAGLDPELDYEWKSHGHELKKASKAFYGNFGYLYWPHNTFFTRLPQAYKYELVTYPLKYLLYEMNHQDYRLQEPPKPPSPRRLACELERLEGRPRKLPRSGTGHTRYQSTTHGSTTNIGDPFNGHFFSSNHQRLSGMTHCEDEEEEEGEEEEEEEETRSSADITDDALDSDEQMIVLDLCVRPLGYQQVDEDNVSHNAVPRNPVRQRNRKGECGICFEDYSPCDSVIWCKVSCGQTIHLGCFNTWRERFPALLKPTCIYCREPWQD